MDNYWHILVKEIGERGITKFMRNLTTAYTMYFNEQYNRVGLLFQGTFKAEHVNDDSYLQYIYAYIHLNPDKLVQNNWREVVSVSTGALQKFVFSYPYSRYLDYALPQGKRKESRILDKESFPEYFGSAQEFKKIMRNGLPSTEVTPL